MPAEQNHNKLITQAAREVLRKEGLFQKGSSRVWIDDNGWYLIVVEFQPSAWDKGAYLNVSVSFLWEKRDYLAFEYGHRVKDFVSYSGDDAAFYADMLAMAETAMEKVRQYRGFCDLPYAKEQIFHSRQGHPSRLLYQRMMICGLCKDPDAVKCCNELLNALWPAETAWEKAYYSEVPGEIAPIVHDADRLYDYVCGKINDQRAFWRAKSSMRKMKQDCFG